MKPRLKRREVLDSIRNNVQDENTVRHMLATEAVMRALARRLGENEQEWGITGLVHDIDEELVEGDMASHGRLGADLSQELGATEAMAHAILCHNEVQAIVPESKLDKALFCADPLTRLITAAARAHRKKLRGLTTEAVMKRFYDDRFAAAVNRKRVARCQEIGLDLQEFISLGIEAMKGIASQLGL